MKRLIVILFLLLLFTNTIFGPETEQKEKPKKRPNQSLIFKITEQDIIMPIISIEWGQPDRWSITSRYIHNFDKEKKGRTWHNNAGVFLSPGISGGRLGVGYLGIYSPASMRDFSIFSELRGVLLRTWGNPLSTSSNTTFAAAEIKISLFGFLNSSAGYYSPITNENIKSFWGFHFGVGF